MFLFTLIRVIDGHGCLCIGLDSIHNDLLGILRSWQRDISTEHEDEQWMMYKSLAIQQQRSSPTPPFYAFESPLKL